MTKKEILQKIGEQIAILSHNASQMCEEYEGYRLACMDVSDILDEITKELSKSSLPSDLDEAAEEYAEKHQSHDIYDCYGNPESDTIGKNLAFRAGAEWMAEYK